VGTRLWTLDQLRAARRHRRTFEPSMSADQRQTLLDDWGRALDRARAWVRE
jgi:hypothetical protein